MCSARMPTTPLLDLKSPLRGKKCSSVGQAAYRDLRDVEVNTDFETSIVHTNASVSEIALVSITKFTRS